jgi:hypothetical protein
VKQGFNGVSVHGTSRELYDWFKSDIDGKVDSRKISIEGEPFVID